MTALSEDQVAAWRRDGYLFPLPLLSETERQDCLAGLARFEAWLGAPVNASKDLKWRTMPHLVLPWVAKLAHDPRIVDAVEQLIGPDLMVFTSTFFIKETGSPTVSDWHQDSTYYGLEPKEAVTVWVALSNAEVEAGCMDVLPVDGVFEQLPHAAGVVENSVNRAAQRITVPLDEARAVAMPLQAGQFSMHHGLTAHRSGPNTSNHRRIGLGMNFVPADARPVGAERTAGMLVRGTDRHGNFEPVSPPDAELSDAAVATHALAVARYSATYHEQEPLHARTYG
ncbi:MAG: phytanoyl-CoA dioxygenase family protein [Rhodospirillaceae bacterium]